MKKTKKRRSVNVALVQTSSSADVKRNMERTAGLIRKAAKKGAQIVCLQELYRTEYFCKTEAARNFDLAETIPGPSTELFSKLAKALNVVIIAPLFEKRAAGVYHNTAVVFDADGRLLGSYRKMHIPDDPGFYEKFYFVPGDLGFKTFKTKFATIGVLICWDQWFPEAARLTALSGAEILFYPTAIGWKAKKSRESKTYQMSWETVQRGHAIANGVYVAAANRVGREGEFLYWGGSFITDPSGAVVARAGKSEEILLRSLDLNFVETTRREWPFLRDRRIDAYHTLTSRFLEKHA